MVAVVEDSITRNNPRLALAAGATSAQIRRIETGSL
jgi:hypothetical protein